MLDFLSELYFMSQQEPTLRPDGVLVAMGFAQVVDARLVSELDKFMSQREHRITNRRLLVC